MYNVTTPLEQLKSKLNSSRKFYFVYVLRNPDGKLYIGQTNNLVLRMQQHNDPSNTFTMTTNRWRGPWMVVHSETVESRSAARAREKALKSGQGHAWLKSKLGC